MTCEFDENGELITGDEAETFPESTKSNPPRWRRLKKWLAAVLGLPTGQHITIPTGAMLIMPRVSTVDTLNVCGGTVQFTETKEKLTSIVNRTGYAIDWEEAGHETN